MCSLGYSTPWYISGCAGERIQILNAHIVRSKCRIGAFWLTQVVRRGGATTDRESSKIGESSGARALTVEQSPISDASVISICVNPGYE